jgi:nucleotide-binding universal stress UspA family protein
VKRILVALDGSPRAAKVLEASVRLAELTGSKLVLYRAMGISPDLPREAAVADDAKLEDLLRMHAHRDLETLAQTIPKGIVEEIVTELATAWDGICRTAKERDVDLIAIGSHGYGGLDRILGTVAAKVVNRADRNVLVVRTVL